MKTTIENESVLQVIDEYGTILHEEKSVGTKTIHSAEPPFIKLYLADIMYMKDMPKAFASLTYALLTRASYANDEEGLCVTLAPYTKTKILAECGWDKMQTLNNALNKLVKGNIIKRLGTGCYQFNPFLFGRGEWKDIEKIRLEWDYDDVNGKTFSTAFTYKSEVTEHEGEADTNSPEPLSSAS